MLNPDSPIKTANEDILNRHNFALNLASVIVKHSRKEGLTLGLYGKWGSGKTSLINMILESIDKIASPQSKPLVLRFNPWLCSDPNQLISQFFKQLSSLIKREKKQSFEQICKYIDEYAEVFELAESLPVAGKIIAAVRTLTKHYAKQYDKKQNDLQFIKDQISNELNHIDIKIIITIDDVDRLSNSEIVSVFQLVKSLADFPNTFYLLAFDREVVVRALSDVQKGDGEEYLEKIVQVPFEIPVPNASGISDYFINKLDLTLMDVPETRWDTAYWSSLYHEGIRGYLTSIRDINRYINAFSLKYELLKEEVYAIDLIGLVCLQVFEPSIYSVLPYYKDKLSGTISHYTYELANSEKEEIKGICNQLTLGLDESRKRLTIEILALLFPKISSSLDLSTYGFTRPYNSQKTLRNSNICNPACFDRYFSLTLQDDEIPNKEIDYLLFNASWDEISSGITKYSQTGRISRFFEHLEAAFAQEEKTNHLEERATLVFRCLYRVWHTLSSDKENAYQSMPFEWRLLFCSSALLLAINSNLRFLLVKDIFADPSVTVSTLVTLLRDFESQHNRFTDEKAERRECLLSLDQVLELEELFRERVMHVTKDEDFLDINHAAHILWLMEQLAPSAASACVADLTKSPLGLAKYISINVNQGRLSSADGTLKIWRVDLDKLKKHVDIDNAFGVMKTFVLTNEFDELVSTIKENIIAFLIQYNRKEPSTSLRDEINFEDIRNYQVQQGKQPQVSP